jgi:archaemetzincin
MQIMVCLVGRTIPGFNEVLDSVRKTFRAKVNFAMIDLPVTRSYNSRRKQYDAGILLNDLFRFAPPDADKAVYIVRDDLYHGRLNFAFGLAAERACLVSTARLDPRFYGETEMDKARILFKERVVKEVVHELGHTMGLPHCDNKSCVMVFSNTIDEVDRKGMALCEHCSKALYLDK